MTPEDLLAIETQAITDVAGHWQGTVSEFQRVVLLILAANAGADLIDIAPKIESELAKLVVAQGMDAKALKAVTLAHKFGVALYEFAMEEKAPKIPVSKNSIKAVTGFDQAAKDAVAKARENLHKPFVGSGQTAILTAIAPVLQHPAKVAASTAWAVNNGSNSAVAKLAKKSGERLCWVSERDSCVHCLALSGLFNDGGDFPSDVTFGAKPIKVKGTLYHPPLHPHCRCHVEINITQEYADALRRESVRSVLKGFKLPSESEKVRIDAAKRLLDSHPSAPSSVQKYAERSIRKGKFS